jgi:hypothetical protein
MFPHRSPPCRAQRPDLILGRKRYHQPPFLAPRPAFRTGRRRPDLLSRYGNCRQTILRASAAGNLRHAFLQQLAEQTVFRLPQRPPSVSINMAQSFACTWAIAWSRTLSSPFSVRHNPKSPKEAARKSSNQLVPLAEVIDFRFQKRELVSGPRR